MATASFEPQKFNIGHVFSTTFAVIGRNAPLYLGLAFIISGLPQILFQYLVMSTLVATAGRPDGVDMMTQMYGKMGYFALSWIVLLLLGALLQSALSRATIEDLGGRQPSFGESLRVAILVLPQTIAVSLLVGLGAGVGTIFLLVPGIILWLMWCVSIPVLVQERAGVFGSISRSSELTRGSRWALFGLFLIVVVVVWLISVVIGLIGGLSTAMLGSFIGTIVGAGITATISAVLMTTVAAASYVELRRTKEGTGVEELAQIFA